MTDVLIQLVQQTTTKGADGQTRSTEVLVDVLARLSSAGRSEFFSGRQAGFTPELVFEVAVSEYSGEELLVYNGTRYRIYRTYESDPNTLELHVERKAGVN